MIPRYPLRAKQENFQREEGIESQHAGPNIMECEAKKINKQAHQSPNKAGGVTIIRSVLNSEVGKKSKEKTPVKAAQSPYKHKIFKNIITPKRSKKKGGKLLNRTLTPPRYLQVGCGTKSKTPTSEQQKLVAKGGTRLTLSPNFPNVHQFEIRTSEFEPSDFQVEIPTHSSLLAHCKICSVLEDYLEKGGINFDLSSLMPWGCPSNMENNRQHQRNQESPSLHSTLSPKHDALPSKEKHPVLSCLEDIVDDIIVEGFFREYNEDCGREGGLGRVEACVFSSHKLRRFIVCYRASSDLQDRPIQGTQYKRSDSNIAHEDKHLPNDFNTKFSMSYHINLETSVFTLLKRLSSLKPFCDVVMTGHSFGATLATIAALNYAHRRPEMRLSCHIFGCPRVGGNRFRNEVHCLPNLNVR